MFEKYVTNLLFVSVNRSEVKMFNLFTKLALKNYQNASDERWIGDVIKLERETELCFFKYCSNNIFSFSKNCIFFVKITLTAQDLKNVSFGHF